MKIFSIIVEIIVAILGFLGVIASLIGVVLAARDSQILSLILFCMTAITCFVCSLSIIEASIK